MPVYKKCPKCGKKIEQYTECECMIQSKKDSYKRYKERRRMDREDKIRQDFYSSKAWIRLRDVVKSDCYGMDIVMLYKDQTIESGYTVHHIITLEDDYSCRLDMNNCIYVTEHTHQLIHAEYNKGDKHKKAMQSILFGLLDRFNKEYK